MEGLVRTRIKTMLQISSISASTLCKLRVEKVVSKTVKSRAVPGMENYRGKSIVAVTD